MGNLFRRRTGALLTYAVWVGLISSPVAQSQTAEEKKDAPSAQAALAANESKGMPPRAAPSDYQVQMTAGKVTIAADFDGHSVPTMDSIYASEDYVVVEVAFFGPPEARLKLSIGDFSLQVGEKKAPLVSQPFGYLTHSLKDPEWQPPEEDKEKKSKTGINTGGGGGDNGPVVPPKMPLELRRAMELKVRKSVLPEGDRALPVAGLIFFQYRGKPQNIKQMELVYSGPAGEASAAMKP
jgi:hypothetical protein